VGGDGTIYIGGQDGYVYALDPAGTLKWEHQTGTVIQTSPAIGPDGTLYLSGWQNVTIGPWILFAFGPGPGVVSRHAADDD
jgi:outer membrane protein assembly factor BamB